MDGVIIPPHILFDREQTSFSESRNSRPVPGCPLSLITDDGEFLIVLNVHATDSALRIYRRDHLDDQPSLPGFITEMPPCSRPSTGCSYILQRT